MSEEAQRGIDHYDDFSLPLAVSEDGTKPTRLSPLALPPLVNSSSLQNHTQGSLNYYYYCTCVCSSKCRHFISLRLDYDDNNDDDFPQFGGPHHLPKADAFFALVVALDDTCCMRFL